MAFSIGAIAALLAAFPASATSTADAVARIDTRLTAASADGSGFAIIVERNGEVIFRKRYGLDDRAAETAFTTETIAQIGSITKQFTATAALTLVHRGQLALDAPVNTYLPEAQEPLASVTLHQLMTHTAGLPEYCGDDFDRMPPKKMLAECLSKPLLFEPGTSYSYSNPGLSVVAAIVEAASGESLEEFLRKEILDPNGLKGTGYSFTHARKRAFAHAISRARIRASSPTGSQRSGVTGGTLRAMAACRPPSRTCIAGIARLPAMASSMPKRSRCSASRIRNGRTASPKAMAGSSVTRERASRAR